MKNKLNNISSSLNININKDDSDINNFLFCWHKFLSRPNKIIIHNTYSTNLFKKVISKYSKEENNLTEIIPTDEDLVINEKIFIEINIDEIYCSYVVIDRDHESSIVSEISFFYLKESNFDKIDKIIEELNSAILDFCESESNKINTISITQNGLEIEAVEFKIDSENFNKYYNKNTSKDINKLLKDIKKSDKGLSILYGERGTGKTSIIKYIADKLDRILIFIPNSMIELTINNSEFRKFLKRYDRPVIVIDDCEMLFNEFFNKSNMFTNNLLQMVDGFLSDEIGVNIIAIFNVDSDSEIDHSLLECNNLLRIIPFEYLTADESTDLSEIIGNDRKYKNKTRVLDIIRNKKPKGSAEIGF